VNLCNVRETRLQISKLSKSNRSIQIGNNTAETIAAHAIEKLEDDSQALSDFTISPKLILNLQLYQIHLRKYLMETNQGLNNVKVL
jgi:hypothetical protein